MAWWYVYSIALKNRIFKERNEFYKYLWKRTHWEFCTFLQLQQNITWMKIWFDEKPFIIDSWLTGILLSSLQINWYGKYLTILETIFLVDAAGNLVKDATVKKSWRTILLDEENEISAEDNDNTDS